MYDISPPVNETSPRFPGDTPYHGAPIATVAAGSSVNLNQVTTSGHIGAHYDTYYHFDTDAPAELPADLSLYVGECIVVQVSQEPAAGLSPSSQTPIGIEHIQDSLEALGLTADSQLSRILINYYPQPVETFDENSPGLAPELIAHLSARGAFLIGSDLISFDPVASKELAAHRAAQAGGVLILENLTLAGVPAGHYHLSALPLAWTGTDAVPTRAVLQQTSNQ